MISNRKALASATLAVLAFGSMVIPSAGPVAEGKGPGTNGRGPSKEVSRGPDPKPRPAQSTTSPQPTVSQSRRSSQDRAPRSARPKPGQSRRLSVTSEDQLDDVEVTRSAYGSDRANTALRRWAELGFETDPDDLRVVELRDDGVLIAPKGLTLVSDSAKVRRDGSIEIQTIFDLSIELPDKANDRAVTNVPGEEDWHGSFPPVAPKLPRTDGSGKPEPPSSALWEITGEACFSRVLDGGESDTCLRQSRLIDDGSTEYDWFLLHHFATARSVSPYSLDWVLVGNAASRWSDPLEWEDWSPKSDIERDSCGTETLSVSAQGATASSDHEVCELWDAIWDAEPGRFHNVWIGDVQGLPRETAYMIIVKVAQDDIPKWQITAKFQVSLD